MKHDRSNDTSSPVRLFEGAGAKLVADYLNAQNEHFEFYVQPVPTVEKCNSMDELHTVATEIYEDEIQWREQQDA